MRLKNLELVLVFGIFLFFIANVFLLFQVKLPVGTAGETLPVPNDSNNVPAIDVPRVGLVSIVNSDCEACFSLSGLADAIRQQGIEFESEQTLEFDAPKAKALISDYNLTRVPAMIVTANTAAFKALSPLWASVGEIRSDEKTFVFSNPPPVFFDVAQNRVAGVVDVTVVRDSNCAICNQSFSSEELSAFGVVTGAFSKIEFDSPKGQELLSRYNVRRIPFAVFSSDIQYYDSFFKTLLGVGTLESDGMYVFRAHPPVYHDLDLNRLVGQTNLVLLDMPSCETCYDANVHQQILEKNFGVFIADTRLVHYPSDEAAQLIADYNISKLPTMLLGGEPDAYSLLSQAWPDFGVVAADGNFVFTQLDVLGGDAQYFDLDQNKVLASVGVEAQP